MLFQQRWGYSGSAEIASWDLEPWWTTCKSLHSKGRISWRGKGRWESLQWAKNPGLFIDWVLAGKKRSLSTCWALPLLQKWELLPLVSRLYEYLLEVSVLIFLQVLGGKHWGSLHMKGAEIGFSMAIHLKEVIATVLINEPSFTLDIPQIYHDQINQPLPFSPSLLSVSALGLVRL